jgi:uncharacterized RDD family membrane protein YckC
MRQTGHAEAVSQQGHYAGAVSRLAAFALDQAAATLAFSVGTAVAIWCIQLVTPVSGDDISNGWLAIVLYVMWLFVYYAYPWAMSGKTLGMAVLGIQVVTAQGAPIGARTAAVRTVCLPLSFLTLGIGFLPIVFGRDRRALHDRLAGTAVVYAWDAQAARWRFLAAGGGSAGDGSPGSAVDGSVGPAVDDSPGSAVDGSVTPAGGRTGEQ